MEGPPGGIGQKKIPGNYQRGIIPFSIYYASYLSTATSSALILVRSLSLYHIVALPLCGLFAFIQPVYLLAYISLGLYISAYISLSLCASRPVHLGLYVSRPIYLGLCASRPVCLGLCVSQSVCLSACVSQPMCLSACVTRPVCVLACVSRPICLSACVPLGLCASRSVCLSALLYWSYRAVGSSISLAVTWLLVKGRFGEVVSTSCILLILVSLIR